MLLPEIKNRYAESLKRSKSFLNSKNTAAKTTSITQTKELCLLRNQAECPICATKFIGKNHNTEHIHPRALGGLNNDENKIQMCTACNNSRNLTMQSMLGNPPYYKNYQKIQADVDEFILWSELTADDGLQAGSVFSRPHEIFTQARFANSEPPIPQRAYGRFSTWDKNDPPNLNFNKTQSKDNRSKSKFLTRKPGIITRFFDWVFDYQPQAEKAVPEEKLDEKPGSVPEKDASENDEMKLADNIDAVKESKQKQEDIIPTNEVNKFRMDVILMIGLKKLSSIDLGHSIKKLMIERGNEMYNPTSFLKSHGLPRGLRKALETNCGDLLEINGDGAVWHVKLNEELVTNHKKLESELNEKLDASEINKIPLVEFWSIVKNLKEDSGLTWNQFMELFGIKNTGAMGGLVIKSGLLCSTLSSDFIIEKVGKEHFVKHSPSD